MSRRISVADDFSRFPAGRYRTDGPFPGEIFRQRILAPALKADTAVVVDLNRTLGFGSSFLEEAFGGLVREEGFRVDDLRRRLTIQAVDPSLVSEVWSYIEAAGRAAA